MKYNINGANGVAINSEDVTNTTDGTLNNKDIDITEEINKKGECIKNFLPEGLLKNHLIIF